MRHDYPFRYYGREPADWTLGDDGFAWELLFEAPLDAAQRRALAGLYAGHFADGAAGPGASPWLWSGARHAVFTVLPRRQDAARRVFASVAQFVLDAHRIARVRDVVFSHGWAARADRWDAWSLAQQPEADPGPPHPDTSLGASLRRPVDPALPPYATDPSFDADVASQSPRWQAPASSPRPKVGIHLEPVAREDYPRPEPWVPSAFVKVSDDGDGDVLATTTRVPVALARRGNSYVGVVALDADAKRTYTAAPDGVSLSGPVAVDPEGLHAVVAAGQRVHETALPAGRFRQRVDIHANNGPVSAIAWTVDDLWAVAVTSQVMLFDLSDDEVEYVGHHARVGTTSLFPAREATVILASAGGRVDVLGVCAWRVKRLGGFVGVVSHEVQGEVLVESGGALHRVAGLDEAYERWAAPLRKRDEATRKKRFAKPSKRAKSAPSPWRFVEPGALPPDPARAVRDRLRARYGEGPWFSVTPSGAAVVVEAEAGAVTSRSARLSWCPAQGEPEPLGGCATFAREKGVTNLSVTHDDRWLFVVDGHTFALHRVDLAARTATSLDAKQFMPPGGGLLVDIVAVDADNFLALWVDALHWHRREGDVWNKVASIDMDNARAIAWDPASRRAAIPCEGRHRLAVVTLDGDVARYPDAVKVASFREGRLFAQMIDGMWFELAAP